MPLFDDGNCEDGADEDARDVELEELSALLAYVEVASPGSPSGD